MVRRLDMLFLATIALATLLQNSAAQNSYTVGDASGWIIPSTTNFYSTWAANKTFRVGDTLVFNFTTGSHTVAGVTKANFDACNAANPQFLNTTGPAKVVLSSTGEKYYICTISGHCGAGQKLAINVSAATPSPAPQPSSPAPPTATPSPSPRATPTLAPASTPTPAPASTPTPPAPASTPTPPASSPGPSAPVSPPTASSPPPPPIAPTPSSTPSPSSTSPPPSTTPSPPAPSSSSATSLGVAGLFATLLSPVVAVFLC